MVVTGTPETVADTPGSHTGRFLRPLLGLDGEASGSAGQAAARRTAAKQAAAKKAPAKKPAAAKKRAAAKA